MSLGITTGDDNMFLKLLVSQLQNQNPMEPMDNQDMMNQMAQFSTVEAMNNMNTSFGELLRLQQLTGGAGLIGRGVKYLKNGEHLIGTVDSIDAGSGELRCEIGGESVPISDLVRVF